MYRFQVLAHTQPGDSIGLVGSAPELGSWNIRNCLRLQTASTPAVTSQVVSGLSYPLWWTEPIQVLPRPGCDQRVEYKYVWFKAHGRVEWEAWGSNRWIPLEPVTPSGSGQRMLAHQLIIVEDGSFGYPQPYPCSFRAEPEPVPLPPTAAGLKILVLGSSVALGHKAWLGRGWAAQLGQTLYQKYGHQLVNVSEPGAGVNRTLARFDSVIAPHQPEVVIIALSLGNEGLATCHPQERRTIQRRFENGLLQLVEKTRERGAYPILAGVYPHGDYQCEHQALLQETQRRMLSWGIPVLDWLDQLNDDQGRWKPGISFDPAHPNQLGHQLMYEAIDLQLFNLQSSDLVDRLQIPKGRVLLYLDPAGFRVAVSQDQQQLWISNPSAFSYTIRPDWQELQTALQQRGLLPGVYLSGNRAPGISASLAVNAAGSIATTLKIPPGTELNYQLFEHGLLASGSPLANAKLLFQDHQLRVYRQAQQQLWVVNESDYNYNLHPMWKQLRQALQGMPEGVYTDPLQPEAPFRTLMIGSSGLESRVKSLPQSAFQLCYQCPLSAIQRVAILPLGDRCAVRMMLHKMEYDGPAFPFDLTRTTRISDVADIIASRFTDMWNPDLLDYSPEAGRIYHRKWSGLSFAHEVEESDRPTQDMTPIYRRMRERYTARSARFWYTLQHCDQVLFVRTGLADRPGVIDLLAKLEPECQGKPFQLLLLSPQPSEEFEHLPWVLHYSLEFNPDRMYDDLDHWLACTEIFREILNHLNISSKNLFWCPPQVEPQA